MIRIGIVMLMPRHPRPSDITRDHIWAEDKRPLCHAVLDHSKWYINDRFVDIDNDESLCLRCATAWKKGRR